MSVTVDYTFHAMGSDIRLIIEPGLGAGMPDPEEIAEREHAWVDDFAWRLSRFVPDSELSVLNHDPRAEVPASPLLRAAVTAAIWAAERSDGLVDPTLGGILAAAGYDASMDGCEPASLAEALASAPARHPAAPSPAAAWRAVVVDDAAGVVRRPPGTEIDTGGTGKGLCADAVAHRLGGYGRFLVDCGGDIAVGGLGAQMRPFAINIEHPMTGAVVGTLQIARGGVATSGLNVRIWRGASGEFRHHLLDPATGRPAWTGLVGVTAAAPSGALEAETLTKMALLLGPEGARDVLADHGGVIVHDSGEAEIVPARDGSFQVTMPGGALVA